jgi:hypothetical protein
MPAEVIVLEVDPSSALKAQAATAKGFEATEKRAKEATAAIAETTEQASQQTIRIIDRTKNSIDRIAANAEKRASQIGKTAIERLESQRAFDLSRVAGDPRAIERVTSAYTKLISEQRKASADASGFGDRLRQALENPRGALDNLIGGLTGLPGILAAGAVAVGGLAVGIYKIVAGMADWAEQLSNTAIATGLTREQVQLFTAAAREQGVSADILQNVMRGLSKTMEDTSPSAIRLREEFGKMGVEFFKFQGGAQDAGPLLLSIGLALGKIEDPMKRLAKAQELFGKIGPEALKLFNGELGQTVEKLKAVGVAIDEHQIKKMLEMDQRFDEAGRKWDTWVTKMKVQVVELANAIPPGLLYFLTGGVFGGEAVGARAATKFTGFTSPQDMQAAAAARAQEAARGAAVIGAFQRQREQGVPGLQARLGRLTGERQDVLGRIGPGLGEAAARTAVAEVQRLDQEIKSVQDRIKTIQEAPAKAEQARRQAEALDKALHGKRLEMIRESEKAALESAAKQAEEMIALDGRVAQARTEYQRETGLIQDRIRQQGFEQEMVAAQRIRDGQLRNLEGMQAKTVDQKIALEQRKLEIDLAYLKKEEELNLASLQRQAEAEISLARITGENEVDILNRIAALRAASAEQEKILRANTAAEIAAIGKDSANRQAQIVYTEYEKTFERLKDSFGGLFDAMLSRSHNFAQALWGIFQAALLTPVKEAFATLTAELLTGRRSSGGAGGLFGMLGLGGISRAGAPGGTGGFSGPVEAVGPLGTLLPALGGGGSLAKLGGLGGITAAGIAPGILGASVIGGFGAYKLGQRGGLRGGIGGPALGAAAGLFGFGSLAALFPALIAAGPIGWIAAAGIGATVGIIGLLRGKGEDKVREKIQAAYGVTIRDKVILQNIMAIAKQTYGGNLDAAIASQPVRDIIEMYNMTLGSGKSLGLSNVPRPVNAFQSGGQIFQSTSVYAPPRVASPTIVVQSLTLSVNGQSAADALEGRVAPAIASNSRAVVQAANKAQRSNVGRNRTSQTLLAPNLITE